MNKRKIRDSIIWFEAFLFSWLYIPHMLIAQIRKHKFFIDSDIDKLRDSYLLIFKAHLLRYIT